MSGTGNPIPPPKSNPATWALRASPRPTVRFKRGLLIGAAGLGACVIAGVTWLAFRSHAFEPGKSEQQYTADHTVSPDAVAGMPKDYSAPKLGPRLPGDLGGPILERERQLGQNPVAPSAQDQAAESLRQKRAQEETQARDSGVMVQVATKSASPATAGTATANGTSPAPTAATLPASSNGSQLSLDLASDQNNQGHKLRFMNQKDESGIYNPHALQKPASPYEVMAGSIIAASLITGLNSDLPGNVIAQVTENVFNFSGTALLIPQGSRLFGKIDSVVAFGQSRAFLVWQRIILPNGSSVEIDNLPAADPAGYSGLEDEVDYHTWTLLKGIAMSTLLGVGTQVSFGNSNSDLVQAIRQSTQESTNQAGQRIVEKDLNIQNTITVRPGWPLRILISKDIVLEPYKG